MRRGLALALAAGAYLIGAAEAASQGTAAATYTGPVQCRGEDRFTGGRSTVRFDSSPTATVSFAAGGRLERWSYFFLGRRDKRIQARAVRRGQSFSYSAGGHIGRSGRTVVTIEEARATADRVELGAAIKWSSPVTGYVGHGSYSLSLTRTAAGLEYEAVKVVVKLPEDSRPGGDDPVIRRREVCRGTIPA